MKRRGIYVDLTEEERKEIDRIAESLDLSVSSIMRFCWLAGRSNYLEIEKNNLLFPDAYKRAVDG